MILDVCCGALKIYNGMADSLLETDELITIDKRKGDFSFKRDCNWGKSEVIVRPRVVADMRYLPFKDKSIKAIVCDPPHLDCTLESNLGIYYGSWDVSETVRTLRNANLEFSRVLEDNGFLLLKIMNERKNIFLTLLNQFTFFLPIQLKRPRGSFAKKKAEVDGALWLIGSKKPVSQPELEVMPQKVLCYSEIEKR